MSAAERVSGAPANGSSTPSAQFVPVLQQPYQSSATAPSQPGSTLASARSGSARRGSATPPAAAIAGYPSGAGMAYSSTQQGTLAAAAAILGSIASPRAPSPGQHRSVSPALYGNAATPSLSSRPSNQGHQAVVTVPRHGSLTGSLTPSHPGSGAPPPRHGSVTPVNSGSYVSAPGQPVLVPVQYNNVAVVRPGNVTPVAGNSTPAPPGAILAPMSQIVTPALAPVDGLLEAPASPKLMPPSSFLMRPSYAVEYVVPPTAVEYVSPAPSVMQRDPASGVPAILSPAAPVPILGQLPEGLRKDIVREVLQPDLSLYEALARDVKILQSELNSALGLLAAERSAREQSEARLQAEIASLRIELTSSLSSDRRREPDVEAITRPEHESLVQRVAALEPTPMTELEQHVLEIEARGNIGVNLETGRVDVLRDIAFVPRKTTDPPRAELQKPEVARHVLDDIAEVARLFGERLIVEGHTKGGESNFWQSLADDRARLVGQELIHRGVEPDRLTTRGLPGKRGLNKVAVVLHLVDHR